MVPKGADNPTLYADVWQNPYVNVGFCPGTLLKSEPKAYKFDINGRILSDIRMKRADFSMRIIRTYGFHRVTTTESTYRGSCSWSVVGPGQVIVNRWFSTKTTRVRERYVAPEVLCMLGEAPHGSRSIESSPVIG